MINLRTEHSKAATKEDRGETNRPFTQAFNKASVQMNVERMYVHATK